MLAAVERHVMSTQDTSPRVAAQSPQRRVVASGVGAGDPAQRLRQAREAVHRRQRREDHVLHAMRIAQPVGQRLARGHGAVRRHLVDDVVDAGAPPPPRRPAPAARLRSSCSVCARGQARTCQQLPVHARADRAAARRAASCAGQRLALRRPRRRRRPTSRRRSAARSSGPRPTSPRARAGGLGQARQPRARGHAPAPPAAG